MGRFKNEAGFNPVYMWLLNNGFEKSKNTLVKEYNDFEDVTITVEIDLTYNKLVVEKNHNRNSMDYTEKSYRLEDTTDIKNFVNEVDQILIEWIG